MYLLPAIQIEDSDVRLPCPALHLLQFASRGCGNHLGTQNLFSEFGKANLDIGFQQPENLSESILFNSPALLCFALAHCRHQADGPESWGELSRWADRHLVSLLSDVIPISESSRFVQWDSQKDEIGWLHRRFLYKPKVGRLVKFLWHVARTQGRKMSKQAIRDWVTASRVRCDAMPKQLKGKAETILRADDLITSAYDRSPSAHGFETTWQVVQRCSCLLEEFDDRLKVEKLKSLKQLAYGASHEVNNPLANIATRAETLLRGESDPEKSRLLSVVHAQAMRAHDMIADMMLFANPPQMDLQTQDLKKLTQQLVIELKPELQDAAVAVHVREYPGVRRVSVDPTHFQVAMKAIVRNAIEAIGHQGEIRIRFFRESSDWLGISILDTGPGVGAELANHIFDPFYSGREAGRGLGFGLSKAWRIIDAHGGQIFCDHTRENGGKFEIRLPVAHNFLSRIDIARAA
ncbi:MAG: HAMP domain-containing histidine kinase [Mariniblastus sp.]|nr:HAMP domain-containing histidine kinase [Mariniblastus sp.]